MQKKTDRSSPAWRVKVIGDDKVIAKTYPDGSYLFYRLSWFSDRLEEYKGQNFRALDKLRTVILETFAKAGHNTEIPQVNDFIKYLRK
jgi:hypothetical protein